MPETGHKLAVPVGTGGETAWHGADVTPQVSKGGEAYFVVAVRRAHSGKVYSFPALYLNQMPLQFEDENDTRAVTGWHSPEANDDGDGSRYFPLHVGEGDEFLAWTVMPQFDGRVRPLGEGGGA